jgi:hypothetical protein
VILILKKKIFRFIISSMFFTALLHSPVISMAQWDSVTIIADTLPEDMALPPPEEEEDVTEVVVEDTYSKDYPKYFSEKWQYEADTAIAQRRIPASHLKELKDDDDFWYAGSNAEKEKPPGEKSASSDPLYVPVGKRTWFQSLLWVIIIAVFVAAIMWYLMSSNVSLFSKKDSAVAGAGDRELSMEDIFAINYQNELQKAEDAGNYRLAIRLMFLRLLKVMSEKNIIRYQQDKTNYDYLLQLQSTGHYNNFFRVTRNYEYSWYGQFDVTKEAYQAVKNDFNQLKMQLG